jgi:hypothetical protein
VTIQLPTRACSTQAVKRTDAARIVPPLAAILVRRQGGNTVKRSLSLFLMLFPLIAFSCAREKEAEKSGSVEEVRAPAPDERLARAKGVFSAVENGDDKQLDQLLAQGADVNYKRPSDRATPLHLIAQNGRAPIGGYLISAGADVNAKDSSGGTPLHWAAQNGHFAVMRSLIDKGADPNVQRDDGATPLDLAVSRGNAQMVEYLTQSGAKVNADRRSQ